MRVGALTGLLLVFAESWAFFAGRQLGLRTRISLWTPVLTGRVHRLLAILPVNTDRQDFRSRTKVPPPDRREKCIIAMSVWLYVCLSARIFQKPRVQTTPHFRCIWPLAVIRSYSGDVLLCTSGFVDNVMFARNTRRATRSGRVLKLTHQAAAPGRSLMYTIAMFSKTKLNMHLRSLLPSNEIRYC